MNKTIFDFIISLLEKQGPVSGQDEKEKRTYRFLETGHIDSFKLNEFIMEIEDQFDIVLSPEDTQSEKFRSISGLIEIIKNCINSPQ